MRFRALVIKRDLNREEFTLGKNGKHENLQSQKARLENKPITQVQGIRFQALSFSYEIRDQETFAIQRKANILIVETSEYPIFLYGSNPWTKNRYALSILLPTK